MKEPGVMLKSFVVLVENLAASILRVPAVVVVKKQRVSARWLTWPAAEVDTPAPSVSCVPLLLRDEPDSIKPLMAVP
jgi:hypothetical protein